MDIFRSVSHAVCLCCLSVVCAQSPLPMLHFVVALQVSAFEYDLFLSTDLNDRFVIIGGNLHPLSCLCFVVLVMLSCTRINIWGLRVHFILHGLLAICWRWIELTVCGQAVNTTSAELCSPPDVSAAYELKTLSSPCVPGVSMATWCSGSTSQCRALLLARTISSTWVSG